ncbi:uncharacterized protein LOC130993473 isoform X2 [Salvia miltiorrhiza]|uniref:uncharacterized protein LOC130993473 isoform X2 n=1 Tax=Salvia miltiorrhiza TaxID=226208 RepID=UPI0025AC7E5F|nr:uncharacterized protein LOC130993473 isoform X2 [Salvia miltiorrhiza]
MNAVTTTAFCPTSFQLKFALAGRKPKLAFVQTRLPKIDRRSVELASVVVRSSAVNGNGVERRSPGNSSWTNLNSAADDFSGWANGDAERHSGDPKPKKSVVGILAAGAAGIVLVAGITFAAFSMSRRSTSRVGEQMEPLTTEQEESLLFDDKQNQVEGDKNGKEVEMLDSNTAESMTGKDGDPLSINENTEAIESRVSDDTGLRQSSEEGEGSFPIGVKESAISNNMVSPEATDKHPIHDTYGDSSPMQSIQSNNDTIASENPIEPRLDKLADANTLESSEFVANSENSFTDNLNRVSSLNEQSNLSLNPSSVESSISNISTESEPNAIIGTSITQEEILKSGDVLSTVDVALSKELLTIDIISSKIDEVSVNQSVESSVGKTLDGTVSIGTPLLPEDSYQSGYQDLQNDQNDNVSQPLFDSTVPGNYFTTAGIPAPSLVSAALQSPPGKVLVPAVVDQLQSQAFSALQVLKVIEDGIQPGDLCTRREYARWLVQASSALSRNTTSKVYPAMYIENVSELAFDDITPEDPDFPSIQGLAEAGLIASKLSRRDMQSYGNEDTSPLYFSPESSLSRQDLVSWKMALEKRQLPAVDKKQLTGFIDIEKINPDAWPAVVADITAGDQGIITLAFGYTRLFQPEKPVTKAQAAIALSTGDASAIVSEELARIEAETMAENAVSAHSALVAQVEKDLNASFEKELSLEREKINAIEKLAEEARREVEKLSATREEESLSLIKERAAVDSEMEILSRIRREVEEQLQALMSDKLEISYEKERLNKLRRDAETEGQVLTRLQYELEVERKALSMARAWAEDEAKRARVQAKALDEARDRWERQGIKVVVDDDLREEAEAGDTWIAAGKQIPVEESIERSENLVEKLKKMADEVRGKSKDTITKIIEMIVLFISNLKKKAGELKDAAKSKWDSSLQGVQHNSTGFTSAVKEGAKRVAGDWKEGVERLSQKFKA